MDDDDVISTAAVSLLAIAYNNYFCVKVMKQIKNRRRKFMMPGQDAQDQLSSERGKCLEKCDKVQKMAGVLNACEDRVKSKSYTAETCSQEIIDLMEALDHCVGAKAFMKLA